MAGRDRRCCRRRRDASPLAPVVATPESERQGTDSGQKSDKAAQAHEWSLMKHDEKRSLNSPSRDAQMEGSVGIIIRDRCESPARPAEDYFFCTILTMATTKKMASSTPRTVQRPYPPMKPCALFCIISFGRAWSCRASPTCRHTASGSRSYAPRLSWDPAYWHSLRIPEP